MNTKGVAVVAAAVVVMSADEASKIDARPLARIVAHATHSQAPEWFTTAPVRAIRSAGAISISSPRRPPLQNTVSAAATDSSTRTPRCAP